MSKIDNIFSEVDPTKKDEFLSNNESKLNIKSDMKKTEYDYSWLEKIEECITDIDVIVRNPKKFIMQEEEVVNVEKAKKLTQESVKHLATHTNFIQEYDPIEETITPSKVLNINKEESYDIYENRFIYSLLKNLSMFLAKRKELSSEQSSSRVNKQYNYKSSTKLGCETVNINLNLESESIEDLTKSDPSGLSIKDRVDRAQLILSDFMNSPFIRELAAANVVMVKSPIRKTNIILKNQNFQKALELWEFIERYNVNDKLEKNESKNYEDDGPIKKNMDDAFLLDYIILNSTGEKQKEDKEKISNYYLSKIIKEYVENNDDIDEHKFKSMISKEFKVVYKEKIKRESRVESIFKKYFDKQSKKIKKAFEYLD